ncbi:alpha-ketoglutarate-dependent dioxygenase AlkB family protein [Trichothermofontia sp.]
MEQGMCFPAPPVPTVIPIANGELSLYDACLTPAQADRTFAHLQTAIPWRQESITIFGKRYRQPRLIAWYGDRGKTYTYSGLVLDPLPWTEHLLYLKKQVEVLAGSSFNSVLLNYYRDGQDSMGWHSDDEPELGTNPVIASLSLGASRRFCLRPRHRAVTRSQSKQSRSDQPKVELELTHGSLLVMAGATQHHWQHAVPKTAKAIGPRVNLTFRWIYSP